MKTRRGKPCCGPDGNDLKNALNQGIADTGIDIPEEQHHKRYQNHRRHEARKGAYLGVTPIGAGRAPPDDCKVQCEINRRYQHEADRNDCNSRTIKEPETAIVGGKPTDGDCRKRMGDCVKKGHPGHPVGQRTTDRQSQIDVPQGLCRLGDTRCQLGILHRPRRLGTVQLHSADTQHGHHRYRQDNDAHAAQPLELLAVVKNGGRQRIETGKHRRPGCRQARH